MLELDFKSNKTTGYELIVRSSIREAHKFSPDIESAKRRIETDIDKIPRANIAFAKNLYSVKIEGNVLKVFYTNTKNEVRLVAELIQKNQ